MRSRCYLFWICAFAFLPIANGQDAMPVEVRNEVEGLTAILHLIPDGSIVKKGDLVCELDGARFRELLSVQKIETAKAEADRSVAEKNLKLAVLDSSHEQEILAEELKLIQRDVKIAELALKIAKENLAQTKAGRLPLGGGNAQSEGQALDRLNRAELQLSKERGRLKIYRDFTQKRRALEVEVALKRAQDEDEIKRAVLKIQQSRQQKYTTQIKKCKVLATHDGRVIYPDAVEIRQVIHEIAEGVEVRERQILFRIEPSTSGQTTKR